MIPCPKPENLHPGGPTCQRGHSLQHRQPFFCSFTASSAELLPTGHSMGQPSPLSPEYAAILKKKHLNPLASGNRCGQGQTWASLRAGCEAGSRADALLSHSSYLEGRGGSSQALPWHDQHLGVVLPPALPCWCAHAAPQQRSARPDSTAPRKQSPAPRPRPPRGREADVRGLHGPPWLPRVLIHGSASPMVL